MTFRSSTLMLVALLLTAPLLAGCLGLGGEEDGSTPVQKQRADVDDRMGGIQGVVTDEAIQPLVGANLTLAETGETARTSGDGSFAFSLVPPGTYTVTFNDRGFVSAQQEVTVTAGQVSVTDFIVSRLVSDQPFMQAIEYAAFIECGTGVGSPLVSVTLAACAVPNTIAEELGQGGNATNDNFMQFIELQAPIHTMVWEAEWDTGGNALAENLWLVAEIQGHVNSADENATIFQDISVSSPFRTEVNRTQFLNTSSSFKAQCEDGDDAYCGYSFEDQGWPLAVRTFTATDCTPTPVSTCAPLQVRVDHVFTGFYNAPAPEGYSVYGGGAT